MSLKLHVFSMYTVVPWCFLLVQIIQAADSLSISNEAVIGLLKGTTDVLTKMPHDHITAGVRTLCSLQTQHLLGEHAANQPGQARIDPCVWVDRLTAVFRSCVVNIGEGQTHPCMPILEEVWPIISALCYNYQDDQRIVERICRWECCCLFGGIADYFLWCKYSVVDVFVSCYEALICQLVWLCPKLSTWWVTKIMWLVMWSHLAPTVCKCLSITSSLMLSLSRLNRRGWVWLCTCLPGGADWNASGICRGVSPSPGWPQWPGRSPRHCGRPIQTICKVKSAWFLILCSTSKVC